MLNPSSKYVIRGLFKIKCLRILEGWFQNLERWTTMAKILIVDDEVSIRVMLTRMIESLNHEISTAEDGQDAYERIGGEAFDLIISDLKMPRMDGLTLLEKIRGDGVDSAFIILTGHGDLPLAMKARQRFNISNFLVKPIHNMDQFLFDVDSAISRRMLELENRSLMESLRTVNAKLEQKVSERTRELVNKNEELARLSSFRAEVLRVLGHELRTPLAILGGYHHLNFQQNPIQNERIANSMTNSIARLQEKVENALHLLQGAESTRFPLKLETVTPATLCGEVIERINPLISHRFINVESRSEYRECCVWDREKIEAVIEELIVNAVRASPDESRIEIVLSGERGGVMIQVRDRAGGIPEDQLEHIFEPFIILGDPIYHMSGTFEHGAKGIGIGLSTAKMWVELHGGAIQAVNNTDGPGCTFTVFLPGTVREQ